MPAPFRNFMLSVLLASLLSACATNPGSTPQKSPEADKTRSFSFSVVGDIPYNATQAYSLEKFISPELKKAEFVIHVGDFKSGSNLACTHALDKGHKDWMDSLGVPVFYTPGDNDWADCDRASNAPVWRETDRLNTLRQTFFKPVPMATPPGWQAEWQPSQPENASWQVESIRFATIHMIGGNNGRISLETCAAGTVCDTQADITALVKSRAVANLEWVNSVFDKAQAETARAVVIATHADVVNVDDFDVECLDYAQMNCDGFKSVRDLIIKRSVAYKSPVLIIHGDTSPFCWDRSLGGATAPNLWRLNSAGDFILIDAVEVSVHPEQKLPFTAKGVLSDLVPVVNECRE